VPFAVYMLAFLAVMAAVVFAAVVVGVPQGWLAIGLAVLVVAAVVAGAQQVRKSAPRRRR
jgi:apolipoprotein N-acyltransferase